MEGPVDRDGLTGVNEAGKNKRKQRYNVSDIIKEEDARKEILGPVLTELFENCWDASDADYYEDSSEVDGENTAGNGG